MNFLYGDGSQDREQKYYVAAAYLGTQDQWQVAVDAWQAILADAGGIQYFHATEFFSGRQLWRAFTPHTPEHTALKDRFTIVAREAMLIGFAFGVEIEPFERIVLPQLLRETRNHSIRDLRTFAIFTVVNMVSQYLTELEHDQWHNIHIGFEGEQGDGKWENYFEEAKALNVDFTRWFYDFKAEPKELVPVQIADLLAFETRNRGVRLQTVPDAPFRYEFDRMIQRKQIMLTWMEESVMAIAADNIRMALDQYPNGILPLDKMPHSSGPTHPLLQPVWFNDLPPEERERLMAEADANALKRQTEEGPG